VQGFGPDGPVQILFTIVNHTQLKQILALLKSQQPTAFYAIEDVRTAGEYAPAELRRLRSRPPLQPFFWFRKSK
jgi:hypothetical protein